MNLKQLKIKLDEMNVPSNWYSLNEGLKHDALILEYQYGKWLYYYFDERGGRNDEKIFLQEDAACKNLLLDIEFQLKHPPIKPYSYNKNIKEPSKNQNSTIILLPGNSHNTNMEKV